MVIITDWKKSRFQNNIFDMWPLWGIWLLTTGRKTLPYVAVAFRLHSFHLQPFLTSQFIRSFHMITSRPASIKSGAPMNGLSSLLPCACPSPTSRDPDVCAWNVTSLCHPMDPNPPLQSQSIHFLYEVFSDWLFSLPQSLTFHLPYLIPKLLGIHFSATIHTSLCNA